jgi:DNA topoisomerase IB
MADGLSAWVESQHPRDAKGEFAIMSDAGRPLAKEAVEAGAYTRTLKPAEGAKAYLGVSPKLIREVHEFNGSTGLSSVIVRHDGVVVYRYTKEHDQQQADAKFARVAEIEKHIDEARHKISVDLTSKDPKTRELATIASLIDQHCIRMGGQPEEERTGSRGASTIRAEHVFHPTDGSTRLMFPGKSGVRWSVTVSDPKVVQNINDAAERKGLGERLFNASPQRVNDYVRAKLGMETSAKDFRTFHATRIVRAELKKAPAPQDRKECDANVKRAIERAADVLGHSPAVCRESYVNPRVIDDYEFRHLGKKGA